MLRRRPKTKNKVTAEVRLLGSRPEGRRRRRRLLGALTGVEAEWDGTSDEGLRENSSTAGRLSRMRAGRTQEELAIQGVRDPGLPTHKERERRELAHVPFRLWCADCVAGRFANDLSRRRPQAAAEGAPPRVSGDYGLVSGAAESKTPGLRGRS